MTVFVISDNGLSVQSLLPLLFAAYGAIHIAVFTDIRRAGPEIPRAGQPER